MSNRHYKVNDVEEVKAFIRDECTKRVNLDNAVFEFVPNNLFVCIIKNAIVDDEVTTITTILRVGNVKNEDNLEVYNELLFYNVFDS
jgi:hypothetical protein